MAGPQRGAPVSALSDAQQLAVLKCAVEHRLTADGRECTFGDPREAIVHQYEEVYLLGLATGRVQAAPEAGKLPRIPEGRIYRPGPPRFARVREFSNGWLVLGTDADVRPGATVDVEVQGKETTTTVMAADVVAERVVRHRKGNRVTRYVLAEFEPVVDP